MLRRIVHKGAFRLMSVGAATRTPWRFCVSKKAPIHQQFATVIQPVPGAESTDANNADDDGKRTPTNLSDAAHSAAVNAAVSNVAKSQAACAYKLPIADFVVEAASSSIPGPQHLHHSSLVLRLEQYVNDAGSLEIPERGIATSRNVGPGDKEAWFTPPVDDIKTLMHHIKYNADSHIFVKSPIGSGKSSLIMFLRDALKEEAVVVRYNLDMAEKRFAENMAQTWSGGQWHTVKLSDVKMKGKVLIIDEAHLWFSDASSVQQHIKECPDAKYVMMFSSTSAHQDCQRKTLHLATPACITHRPFLMLAFTNADAKKLCETFLLPQCVALLTHYEVQVTKQQVEWLAKSFAAQLHALCDGNRIIMTDAVKYILTELKSVIPRVTPNLILPGATESVTLPHASKVVLSQRIHSPDVFYQWAMRLLSCFLSQQQLSPTNRAMFINSGFQSIENAINWCNVLLANGSVHEDNCKNTIGTVLTRGAMAPIGDSKVYEWSNLFVARWFSLQSVCLMPVCELLSHWSAVNVALFGLAHMNLPAFLEETKRKEEEALAFGDMPFEARLQAAFHGGLQSALANGSMRTTPLNVQAEVFFHCRKWIADPMYTGPEGRIDFCISLHQPGKATCFIEILVVGKPLIAPTTAAQKKYEKNRKTTIETHIKKFTTLPTYKQALSEGCCCVIVFAHPYSLDEALTAAQKSVLPGMQVLVLEFISVLKYRATLITEGNEPLRLGSVHADLCPRRIQSGALVPNQRFMTPLELTQHFNLPQGNIAQSASKDDFNNKVLSSNIPLRDALETFIGKLDKYPVPPLPSSVWVQYETHVFEVTPSKNNVDALKKAVKAEMPSLVKCDAPLLRVKDSRGNVLEVDAPLVVNTKETAYIVE